MFAGMICQSLGTKLELPRVSMNLSQAVIGCFIARSINEDILNIFQTEWFLLILTGSLILIASIGLGWGISRFNILPGSTAIWGLLPGAASAMVMMAEDYGADFRLVAFMQYLRVLLVTVTASLVARFWAHIPTSGLQALIWFEPLRFYDFSISLTIMAISLMAIFIPKVSGGVLIVSMLLGGFIQLGGYANIQLPLWLLACAFALIGWNVGLRFTREVINAAARALPQTFFCILLLIIFCMGLAVLLVYFHGSDLLSSYLGTNPGGVDSAAIIASATKVDLAFVMSLQIMRFLITLLAGPILSKIIVKIDKRQHS
jgi:hypothetical protein